MRVNVAAEAMLTPVTKEKHSIAEQRRQRQASGDALKRFLQTDIKVACRTRSADEFAHQHEQRNHGENIIADGVVEGVLDKRHGDRFAAGHHEDPDGAGDTQRNRHMNSGEHQDQQQDQDDGGDIS